MISFWLLLNDGTKLPCIPRNKARSSCFETLPQKKANLNRRKPDTANLIRQSEPTGSPGTIPSRIRFVISFIVFKRPTPATPPTNRWKSSPRHAGPTSMRAWLKVQAGLIVHLVNPRKRLLRLAIYLARRHANSRRLLDAQ